MKTFNIGKVNITTENNGVVKGFVIKRKVTVRECRYIFKNIFGIAINEINDCEDKEEYNEYNGDITYMLNKWLIGEVSDSAITEYAYDCSDEPLGLFNLLPLILYLRKRNVI